jgi:hypothetical protein
MTTTEIFEVKSGVTSVFLDSELLSSSAGLNLAGTNNTIPPASKEFSAGFPIDEDTNLTIGSHNKSIDLKGTIEHSGTVTFNTNLGSVTVGDFSIGYDETRATEEKSGLFVKDTAGTGAILFDISDTEEIKLKDNRLTVDDADLLVSPEFADYLSTQGLISQNLTGVDVGDIATDAVVAPTSLLGEVVGSIDSII